MYQSLVWSAAESIEADVPRSLGVGLLLVLCTPDDSSAGRLGGIVNVCYDCSCHLDIDVTRVATRLLLE
jgi:hypothetical protein